MHEQKLLDREPTVSWLPMNSPAAAYQIAGGVFGLEGNAWRWTGATASFRLLTPSHAGRFAADVVVRPEVVPCTVTLSVNGIAIATAKYSTPGAYELAGPVVGALPDAVTATLSTDRTFRAPPDTRDLGLVLTAIGFVDPTAAAPPR